MQKIPHLNVLQAAIPDYALHPATRRTVLRGRKVVQTIKVALHEEALRAAKGDCTALTPEQRRSREKHL